MLDFGIAQTFEPGSEEQPPSSRLTPDLSPTGVAGTPAYMAPEQWLGLPSTEATDVWALGVILHELCSGHSPLEPTPAATEEASESAPRDERLRSVPQRLAQLRKRVCGSQPLPHIDRFVRLPAEVWTLLARCLDKNAVQRPAAVEVASELRSMLHGARLQRSADESPFRGLLPFTAQHADLFYGRDTEIAAFVERLRHPPSCPSSGPPGPARARSCWLESSRG